MTSGSPETLNNPNTPDRVQKESIEEIADRIKPDSFSRWYNERQHRQNIQQGKHYFNGPSPSQPPRRHSPSKLKKCHRKVYYRQLNAPEETKDPDGVFWFGTEFEEKIIQPYLQDIAEKEGLYVRNGIWVDYEVDSEVGPLHLKGETDPVIVDSEGKPVLLTEVKTKSSLEYVESPDTHHKAQAHAYMYGLSEKHDRDITDAVILYGDKQTFDIETFRIEFDPWFWRETVLKWAEEHSTYRVKDELPPAEPEFSWECEYCPYRQRCGKGDRSYEDYDEDGFLPGYSEYPREKVIEYLEGNENGELTPALAEKYGDLADRYEGE